MNQFAIAILNSFLSQMEFMFLATRPPIPESPMFVKTKKLKAINPKPTAVRVTILTEVNS